MFISNLNSNFMLTLNQFKAENNISKIDMLRGEGRLFATVREKSLVVAKDCDVSKPLYVIPLSKFNNGVDDTDGSTIVPNAFVIINSSVTVEISL
jgi:hypothetical protein